MIEDLESIASQMAKLLPLFVNGGNMSGLILPTKHAASFKALAIEAKSILDQELGHANDYLINLLHAVNSGAGGFAGGPSYASVEEASEIVRSAIRGIERRRARPPASISSATPYVDPGRILSLRNIGNAKWDFSRLVELCRELNIAAANRCYMSTAMLLRTILNHVSAVLGFSTFAEVANNYGNLKSSKSFKVSMQRLEGPLRNIADMHLHFPIRAREDVPTAT
jgi:hypothetical protein